MRTESRNNVRSLPYKFAAAVFRAMTHPAIRRSWFLLIADLHWRADGINGVADYLQQIPPEYIANLLRRYKASVGNDVIFKSHLSLEASIFSKHLDFKNLSIGNRCLVTRDVYIDITDRVTLEDQVSMSPRSMILTHQSVADRPLREFYPTKIAPVVISSGAWICAGAIVMPGVTIGECAVVAAGAIVTSDVAAYTVVAGIPARVLKRLAPGRQGCNL